jgi:hypothetical protein
MKTRDEYLSTLGLESGIPAHMHEGLVSYLTEGRLPGRFLLAVLENDLMGAVRAADLENRAALWQWVCWLQDYAPAESWGSPGIVEAWPRVVKWEEGA